ncbi:MAG TPA: hypothetical protein VMV15_15725 [Candidatus Binataceae bacterium]|nr:hypothetical protein [Candidatus Binataceae bacterium]
MRRSRLLIVAAIAVALGLCSGLAPRVLAQPSPPARAENPPPPPGAGMMGRRALGPPNMMAQPGQPGVPPGMMAERMERMRRMHEHPGCGGMGPEMGMGMMGMGMGPGMMGLPSDAKSRAELLQLRGKTMQMWGEWMEKRGKELEQQAR